MNDRKQKPRIWPCFIAVSLVVVGMFVVSTAAYLVWEGVQNVRGLPEGDFERASESLAFILPLLLAVNGVNASIALTGGALSAFGIRRRLSLRPSTAGVGTYLLLAIGTFALGMVEVAIVQLIGIPASGTLKSFEDISQNASSPFSIALLVLVIGVGPGVCEELMFRGYVQTRLRQRWGPAWAIIVTSLLFGAIHLDPLQSPLTVFLGLYLGWIAYRTGSIRPAMFAHAFNNGVATLMSALAGQFAASSTSATTATTASTAASVDSAGGGDPTQTLILLLVAAGICIGCTLLANWLLPPTPATEELPPISPLSPPALNSFIAPLPHAKLVAEEQARPAPLSSPVQDGDWYTS